VANVTEQFKAQIGKGRPKGVPNKSTAAIKDMILAALDKAGGADYLLAQSRDNPAAFMTLVGKVLPLQLTGENGGAVNVVHSVRRDIVDPINTNR